MSTNLNVLRSKIAAGARAGLDSAGNILLSEARARCPVDSGALRESGDVQVENNAAWVSFHVSYAAAVHEKYSKFLENPANDPGLRAQMLTALAQHIHF